MKNRQILVISTIMMLILVMLVFSLTGGALDQRGSRPENNPPGIVITQPAGGSTVQDNVTIWMNAWDADGSSDIDDVWVRIDEGSLINATYNHTNPEGQWWYYIWDTTKETNGWHDIRAVVFDGIDDASNVKEYKVDNVRGNTPPTIGFVEPKDGNTVKNTVTIWMIAWDKDNVSDIQKVWIKFDEGVKLNATYNHTNEEGQWWYYVWNTSQETEGWHLLTAITFDGTDDASKSIEVLVDNVQENSAPIVDITKPENGAKVSGTVKIWAKAWDPDGNDDLESVYVRIDEGSWIAMTKDPEGGDFTWWYYNWDSTNVEDGEHHITVYAWDGTDDSEKDKIYIIVDNTQDNNAPGIVIVKPKGGSTVKGTVRIWMNAWDKDNNSDIQNVWVRINEGALQNATYNHTDNEGQWWYYIWNTTGLEDGWHKIKATVYDGTDDGHDLIEILVDNDKNTKPLVNITYPPDDWSEVNGTVKITGYAWDNDVGDKVELVQVAFNSGEGPWFNATDTSGNNTWWTWEYDWNTTQYENGEHAIVARSWDGSVYSDLVDAHVIVNNTQSGGDSDDDEDDDEDDGGGIPGFEPVLIAAAVSIGVVVASFRGRYRRRKI